MLDNKGNKWYNSEDEKRITEEWKPIPLFHCITRRLLMANIEERVESLIQPKVQELGYELYDVKYEKEGKNYFLRVFIDSENRNRLK